MCSVFLQENKLRIGSIKSLTKGLVQHTVPVEVRQRQSVQSNPADLTSRLPSSQTKV